MHLKDVYLDNEDNGDVSKREIERELKGVTAVV